jgi:hypothetical protein
MLMSSISGATMTAILHPPDPPSTEAILTGGVANLSNGVRHPCGGQQQWWGEGSDTVGSTGVRQRLWHWQEEEAWRHLQGGDVNSGAAADLEEEWATTGPDALLTDIIFCGGGDTVV